MRSLFFATALALTACQADVEPTSGPAGEPVEVDRASLPDTAMVEDVTLPQTTALVENATRASPSVAIQTVTLWAARLDTLTLEGERADTLEALRRDLETLRGELQSSPLAGRPIGTTLRSMGRRTSALADGRAEVDALGRALSAVGRTLAPPDTNRVSTGEESAVQ